MNDTAKTIAAIHPVDQGLRPDIQRHLDNLTKPQGSLGRLEEIAMQYGLIAATAQPILGKKKIFCFAGDHGVAAERVSAFPKEVTPQMVLNMLSGGAAINVLARHVGAKLQVVDMGVDYAFGDAPGLCNRKVRRGTDNIARGPAMTPDEAWRAIQTGIELAQEAKADGVTLIGTGEMGIANTTPATALMAAYLNCPVASLTGRGTGLNDAGVAHKIDVINRALEVNRARLTDPLSTLAALGGFEIAAICGLALGGALCKIPVVVDGFISSAGACAAVMLNGAVRDYLFFSHRSAEAGHRFFCERFGVRPLLDLDMRLGEGTGGALAMSLIEASLRIYSEMASFHAAGVSGKE